MTPEPEPPGSRLHGDLACDGNGMVAYWDGGGWAGEMCPGCVNCEPEYDVCLGCGKPTTRECGCPAGTATVNRRQP